MRGLLPLVVVGVVQQSVVLLSLPGENKPFRRVDSPVLPTHRFFRRHLRFNFNVVGNDLCG